MLFIMLALYMMWMNLAGQAGILPSFQYYARQPTEETHYNLKFVDINGEQQVENTYLDSPNSWLDKSNRRDAMQLVNKLGIAVFAGEHERAEQLHEELTTTYFSDIETAQYELVLRVVRPVEKYAIESDIIDEPVRTYQYRRLAVTQ